MSQRILPLDLNEAEKHFLSLTKLNPHDAEAWFQLAMIAQRRSQLPKAVEVLKHAIAATPDHPIYRHHLGSTLQALGQHEAALEHFDAVIRLRPECGEAHNNHGIALARLGQRNLAESAFRRAILHRPDFPEAFNNLGSNLVEQGKIQEAIASFEEALAQKPNYAEARHNLGYAQIRLGKVEAAAEDYRSALRLKPDYVEAHLGLASLQRKQGEYDEAIQGFRKALTFQPQHLDARIQLAFCLTHLKKIDEAISTYHQALLFHPDSHEIYNQLGSVLAQSERYPEAAAALQQAIKRKPDFADAINNLGNVLLRQDQASEAVAHFRQAIELRCEFPQPHCNLGSALLQLGNYDEAIVSFQEAIRLQPKMIEAHFNLGNAYRNQGSAIEAETTFRHILVLQPDHAAAQLNLGVALAEQGRFPEAEAAYHAVLKIKPDMTEVYNSIGVIRLHQRNTKAALEFFDLALTSKPDDPDVHLNRALTLLAEGDYEHGWTEYEWRWKTKKALPRTFDAPAWDGNRLSDGTILLHAEQGFGDTIQFIRFATLVRDRVSQVIVECPPALKGLLMNCPDIDEVFEIGSQLPDFDVHAPLMSLPRLLGTTLATIPSSSAPYLFADSALRQRWRGKLSEHRALKVGIAWQGNPRYAGDRYRSMKLAQLRCLAEVPGVQYFSLQKGKGSEQLEKEDWLLDLGKEISADFEDTAAAISELDLVIAVDTSVTHLAGALDIPTWIMLPYNSDWRWLRERTDSVWYSSVRLFRQAQWGNWEEVIQRVVQELKILRKPMHRYPIVASLADLGMKLAKLKHRVDPSQDDWYVSKEKKRLEEMWSQAMPSTEAGDEWLSRLSATEVALDQVQEEMNRWQDFDEDEMRAADLLRRLVCVQQERRRVFETIDSLIEVDG